MFVAVRTVTTLSATSTEPSEWLGEVLKHARAVDVDVVVNATESRSSVQITCKISWARRGALGRLSQPALPAFGLARPPDARCDSNRPFLWLRGSELGLEFFPVRFELP